MKISTLLRFAIFCCLFISISSARAQYVALPDTFFGYWLYNNGYNSAMTGSDSTGYKLDTTNTTVLNATSLDVNKTEIKSLWGLQFFKNLRTFSLTQPQVQNGSSGYIYSALTYVPSFASTLHKIIFNIPYNQALRSLPDLPSVLDTLTIDQANSLDSLPLLPAGLTYLDVAARLEFQNYYQLPAGLLHLRLSVSQTANYYSGANYFLNSSLPFSSLSILLLNDQAFTFPSSITYLDLSNSNLALLPTLPPAVRYLKLDYNFLDMIGYDSTGIMRYANNSYSYALLPNIPATDTLLSLNYNYANAPYNYGISANFPPLPIGLKYLYAFANRGFSNSPFQYQSAQLSELLYADISGNYNWQSFPPTGNKLRYLDGSYSNYYGGPPSSDSLQDLFLYQDTLISYIPFYPNAIDIRLANCRLDSNYGLPQLPPTLQTLDVSFNQTLTTLPVLDSNLIVLYCSYNNISSLPDADAKLQTLDCSNNPNLHCLPDLRNVQNLGFGGTAVTCVPSYGVVASSTPNIRTVPLCQLNNPSGCASLSSINGIVYNDSYSGISCQYDTTDNVVPNVSIRLYQGNTLIQQTFSRQNGVYGFNVPYGTYRVELDTTSIFPLVIGCGNPSSINVTVNSSVAGISNADFPLVCGSSYDLAVDYISNGPTRMRPATSFTLTSSLGESARRFHLNSCANVGGVVKMDIYGSAKYVGPAPGAQTPTVTGNELTWNVSDFAYANNNLDYNVILQIDTHAHAGDQICITLYVDSTTGDVNHSNNTLTQCFTVISSYDPNLKEASPSGYVQVSNDWLVYTIHFQNTGTDTAFNITVTDQLDTSKYDLSTFTMLNSSNFSDAHLNTTTGLLTVLFPYIDLVDSLSDPLLSQGWFQFKIKPKGTVPNNVDITNTANIFFDYNPPVQTNVVNNVTIPGCYSHTLLSLAICGHDTLHVGAMLITAPGHYIDTLLNVSGCDSIVDVTVYQNRIVNENYAYTTVCSPYPFDGVLLSVSGDYYDTLTTALGCDSINILHLTVDPFYEITISVQTCTGGSYNFYGQTLTATGIYSDTIPGLPGTCDTLVTLYYTVNPQYVIYNPSTICKGDSFDFHGHLIADAGWYVDTVSGGTACDTIYQTYLFVNTQAYYWYSDTICRGGAYVFGDSTYSTSGVYSYTVPMAVGCDSVKTLTLTVLDHYSSSLSAQICAGATYSLAGHTYYTSGTYIDTLTSVRGCDSIITLQLTVTPLIYDTISQSICQGDSFIFGGSAYHIAGYYSQIVGGVGSCDSLLTLHLMTIPVSRDTISQSICSGDSFTFAGVTYHSAGYYTQTLTASTGCDSLHILHLMLKPLSYDTISQAICSGDSFTFAGISHQSAGYFSQTLTGRSGCDSIVTLHLTVKPLSHDTISQTICSGDSFTFAGISHHTAGYYSHTFTGRSGCDSIVTLHLSINPPTTIHWSKQDTTYTLWCIGNHFWLQYSRFDSATPVGGTYSGVFVVNDSIIIPAGYRQNCGFDTTFMITYTYTDSNGCVSSLSKKFIYTTYAEGINEISEANPISLYPNPNKGTFTLQTTRSIGLDYTITDVLGKLIAQGSIHKDTEQIELPEAEEGIYNLVVKGSPPIRFVIVR